MVEGNCSDSCLPSKSQCRNNIVIALPDDSQFCAGNLIILLELVANLQLKLLSAGFPIRGGVSHGMHYMDGDFAFGEALIDAVQFDQSGTPPRLVLSDKLADLAVSSTFESKFPFLVRDCDEKLVAGYLGALFEEFPEVPINFDVLAVHRDLIIAGLSSKCKSICEKYQWLACYHNFACRQRQNCPYPAEDQENSPSLCDTKLA